MENDENPNRVSTKEFSVLCGIEGTPLNMSTLYTDIKRKNVNQGSDYKIDITDPINIEYIELKKEATLMNSKSASVEFDRKKKRLEVEKAHEDLKIARIKRQKLEGEVIPHELVTQVFKSHFKSITQSFHNASEQMAIDVVKRLNGKRSDISWAKGVMVSSVNDAVRKSKAMSAKEISNIVEEYSNSKTRGERGAAK